MIRTSGGHEMKKTLIHTLRLLSVALLFALALLAGGDRDVVASRAEPARRALVIGVSDYPDPPFPPLEYPRNDVARMEELLKSPRYGFQVTALNDDTSDKPTRVNILKYIR